MLSLTDGYPLGLRTYLKIKKQGCPPDLQGIVSTILYCWFFSRSGEDQGAMNVDA